MRVKKYVVDSIPDALQKIRTDLGKDAVILNTKEIRIGGFLGMFGKKKVEVIAAIDASSNTGSSGAPRTLPQSQPERPQPPAALPNREASYRSDFPEVPDVLPPMSQKEIATLTAGESVGYKPQQAFIPQQPPPRVHVKEELLLEELRQMKEMMHKLTNGSLTSELPEALKKVEQRLRLQEIDPILVERLISEVMTEHNEANEPVTEDSALRSIRMKLGEILRPDDNKRIKPSTRVVHFVGPTGVGKTTTIAKLAAEQVLKYQRKVGFITSDTYRIAAIEQLKTYATILNVPLEVVFSPQDLVKAFHNLEGCDIIFMDTAGRNFRNEMYVSELNALLRTNGNSETFLVLSLTTKYQDMRAITNNFNRFKLDKVLLTKMDETESYGAIVNLVHEFSLQLSYVTNGQNVPDDITEIDERHIVDLLLEESQL